MSKVIIFQDDEKSLNYKYQLPKNSNFSSLPIKVLSYEYDKDDFLKKNKVIVDNTNFDINTIFLLHPTINDLYIEESKFEEYIYKEKIHRYIEMADKLGAKKIQITSSLLETKKLEKDINGGVKYKGCSIEGSYKKEVEEKFKNEYLNLKTFTRTDKFNLEDAHSEATKWIENDNLYFDQELVHFVKSCDPKKNNILETQVLKTKITKEANQTLEIAANLDINFGGVSLFSLKGGFSEKIQTLNEFSLEIHLEF
ncbi:hypothetical protein K5I29_11060 [Flavobacterium agricola]|uniref:Uncharacterized protein n=1 Tax=Flavobacterium agricola TaxID=2870839 RepID=A0ABY6LYF7_9FLAO|nr:hypothetical protein [Flavobacterium agricola]UYW01022.1 hypothetical protein K5I29_11060 [Flavobacterium agricola]